MKNETNAEKYQTLCIAEGWELELTPEECNEGYESWEQLEAEVRSWQEE